MSISWIAIHTHLYPDLWKLITVLHVLEPLAPHNLRVCSYPSLPLTLRRVRKIAKSGC